MMTEIIKRINCYRKTNQMTGEQLISAQRVEMQRVQKAILNTI